MIACLPVGGQYLLAMTKVAEAILWTFEAFFARLICEGEFFFIFYHSKGEARIMKKLINAIDPVGKLFVLKFRPKETASVVKNGEFFYGVCLKVVKRKQQTNFVFLNYYNEGDIRSLGEGTEVLES